MDHLVSCMYGSIVLLLLYWFEHRVKSVFWSHSFWSTPTAPCGERKVLTNLNSHWNTNFARITQDKHNSGKPSSHVPWYDQVVFSRYDSLWFFFILCFYVVMRLRFLSDLPTLLRSTPDIMVSYKIRTWSSVCVSVLFATHFCYKLSCLWCVLHMEITC